MKATISGFVPLTALLENEANLTLSGKLQSAAVGAVIAPIAIGFLIALCAQAQAPSDKPQFEVASVKPSLPPTAEKPVFIGMVTGPNRFSASSETLADLIARAYGLDHSRISGGPPWIAKDRFDVIATFPQGTSPTRIPLMLQALLAERFGLIVGRETRTSRVYFLVEAKSGLKLKPVDPDSPLPVGTQPGSISSVPITIGQNGALRICCGLARLNRISMARFAEMLSAQTDRPVQDETGIQGVFNISLEWTPENLGTQPEGTAPLPEVNRGGVTRRQETATERGSSIYTAVQEQLGLRLEPRTAPLEYLIIERAEKPTEN